MILIKWNKSLSVNITEIDNQHKILIDLINTLNEAMHQGVGQTKVNMALTKLIDYTDYHFKTEEKYFDSLNYDDTQAHKREHNNLRNKVLKFQDDYNTGRQSMTIDLTHFLIEWLKHHILVEDMKYVEFFHSKGIK